MELFTKLLKWIGCGLLVYPLVLVFAYLDSGGNVSKWFWLEILIIEAVVCVLSFLFIDFELIKRIKNKKQKNKK